MKKLLLIAGAVGFSLNLAIAQSPGAHSTYAYDDFKQVAEYTDTSGAGVYWYSGAASAPNGTRAVGSATFAYTNSAAGIAYLAANFGSKNAGATLLTLDLTSQSDIEVDLENTSSSDLQLRFVLTDINNNFVNIEPNISDCIGVPDFATPDPNATWTGSNLVYPQPLSYPNAVYPTVAYNGFIIPANTRGTYRLDLSSVPTAKGGRLAGSYAGTAPINSPSSSIATTAQFDITKVHAAEFIFNENTAFNLSDKGLDTTSYRYDAQGILQNNWTGSLVFRSFKIGSILSPLGVTGTTTGIIDDAIVDVSLQAYPNPAKENLTVSFKSTAPATVTLTDLIGNTAYTTPAAAGLNKIDVNTSNFGAGIYILTVSTDKGIATRKIFIQ